MVSFAFHLKYFNEAYCRMMKITTKFLKQYELIHKKKETNQKICSVPFNNYRPIQERSP